VEHVPAPSLSIEELHAATGEPAERLRQFRSLALIGSLHDACFSSQDVERVRLIQFLERRQISLERIARGERDEAVLTSVIDFLYPRGSGRRYSLGQAAEMVGLDAEVARRLREAAAPSDELLDEHDIRLLQEARVVLDAGFRETALLQLVRVYADALQRVAEAEVRLFHFYVHEGLKATGLTGHELTDTRKAVMNQILPVVEPMLRYFHHRGLARSVREDMVLHLADDRVRPAEGEPPAQLRLAIVFLDLSSYTPMTEVMGDAVAARIVERLSELVRDTTMRFDGRIVDRIGDAFLLVFPEPQAAIACALEIERRTAAEPQFPALRGAVHWGDVVYQEGGYVGGSLNIAARVAAEAKPHQILVTATARGEVHGAAVTFSALGRRPLKGLADDLELFEARSSDSSGGRRARDPVCGMEMVATEIGARLTVSGRDLAFCCEKCLKLYLETPERYHA
jgi:adenylate cyclase